jgi:hypothetical protein
MSGALFCIAILWAQQKSARIDTVAQQVAVSVQFVSKGTLVAEVSPFQEILQMLLVHVFKKLARSAFWKLKFGRFHVVFLSISACGLEQASVPETVHCCCRSQPHSYNNLDICLYLATNFASLPLSLQIVSAITGSGKYGIAAV